MSLFWQYFGVFSLFLIARLEITMPSVAAIAALAFGLPQEQAIDELRKGEQT